MSNKEVELNLAEQGRRNKAIVDERFEVLRNFVDRCIPQYRPDATEADKRLINAEWELAKKQILEPLLSEKYRVIGTEGSDAKYLVYQMGTPIGVVEVRARRKIPEDSDENRIILFISHEREEELCLINLIEVQGGYGKAIHFVGTKSECMFIEK